MNRVPDEVLPMTDTNLSLFSDTTSGPRDMSYGTVLGKKCEFVELAAKLSPVAVSKNASSVD